MASLLTSSFIWDNEDLFLEMDKIHRSTPKEDLPLKPASLSTSSFIWDDEELFLEMERIHQSTPKEDLPLKPATLPTLSPIPKRTAKRKLIFEEASEVQESPQYKKFAHENWSMMEQPLGQILKSLSSQHVEKALQFDEESKELKKYFLTQALVAVTPTLLEEFTNCLVLQSGLFETPNNKSAFCEDLFEFLRTRTKTAEAKLASYNHHLTLPPSI